MNRKALIVASASFAVLGTTLGTFQAMNQPEGNLNSESYQVLEENLEKTFPGIVSDNFRQQVITYCTSEQSVDIAQLTFRVGDKPIDYKQAQTVKNILDATKVCES